MPLPTLLSLFFTIIREDGERNTILLLGLLRNFAWSLKKPNPKQTPSVQNHEFSSLPTVPHTSGLLSIKGAELS